MIDNTVSWKEYVDTRFDAQDKAVGAALASAEKAVTAALVAQELATTKAEEAQEKRNETFNNFRSLSNDRDKNFATVEKVDGLIDRVNKMENARSGEAGQVQGAGMSRAAMVTIITTAISISGVVIGALVMFK